MAVRAQVMGVAQARQQPQGSVVTVGGVVTVAGEFGKLAFIQDHTGGIAIYDSGFVQQVHIGDSVVVRGVLKEFGQRDGQQGTGLLELIATTLLYRQPGAKVDTVVLTLADIQEAVEGRLVRLDSVFWALLRDDVFPGQSRNYRIFDRSGSGEIRIDRNAGMGGRRIPHTAFAVVGVVSQYQGRYQIMPRFYRDFRPLPALPVADDQVLTLVTWNLNWFGSAGEGPEDDEVQFAGVYRLLDSINADIYLLQEVANTAMFSRLVDSLSGYRGYLAPYAQELRTAYLIKTSEVEVLDTNLLFTAAPADAWAWGRYPFHLVFRWHGIRLHLINLHMKSGTGTEDRQLRWRDAQLLYNGLRSRWQDSLVIIGGDWNDDFDESIVPGSPSPYAVFVQDPAFALPDYWLTERGVGTHRGGSFLDHFVMVATLRLMVRERVGVVLPSAVSDYFQAISDHLPLRLDLELLTTAVELSSQPPAIWVSGKQLHCARPCRLRLFTLYGALLGAWDGVTTLDLSWLPPQPVVYELNGVRGILLLR